MSKIVEIFGLKKKERFLPYLFFYEYNGDKEFVTESCFSTIVKDDVNEEKDVILCESKQNEMTPTFEFNGEEKILNDLKLICQDKQIETLNTIPDSSVSLLLNKLIDKEDNKNIETYEETFSNEYVDIIKINGELKIDKNVHVEVLSRLDAFHNAMVGGVRLQVPQLEEGPTILQTVTGHNIFFTHQNLVLLVDDIDDMTNKGLSFRRQILIRLDKTVQLLPILPIPGS